MNKIQLLALILAIYGWINLILLLVKKGLYHYLCQKALNQIHVKGLDFSTTKTGFQSRKYFKCQMSLPGIWRTVGQHIDLKGRSLLDVGAGKGFTLFEAMAEPFKKVAGVEINTDLAKVIHKNFALLGIPPILIFEQDCLSLEQQLDEYDLFYFFNPFNRGVLSQFLEHLNESFNRKPRAISIVYFYPVYDTLFKKYGYSRQVVIKMHPFLGLTKLGQVHVFEKTIKSGSSVPHQSVEKDLTPGL